MLKKVMVIAASVVALSTASYAATDMAAKEIVGKAILQQVEVIDKNIENIKKSAEVVGENLEPAISLLPEVMSKEEISAFVSGGKLLAEYGNGLRKMVIGGVELYVLCTSGVGEPVAILTKLKDGFFDIVSAVKKTPEVFSQVKAAVQSIGGKIKKAYRAIFG